LQPRRRAEQAFVSVIADAYLAGVSTRRVEKLVQQLGVERMSKSQVSRLAKSLDAIVEDFRTRPLEDAPYPYLVLDALVVKCREGGRTVNACVVHAVAVNREGYRESLGLDVVTSEDGAAWLAFLRSLVARGLTSASDALEGSRASGRERSSWTAIDLSMRAAVALWREGDGAASATRTVKRNTATRTSRPARGPVALARAKSLKPVLDTEPKPLLFGLFQITPWRIVAPLPRPVQLFGTQGHLRASLWPPG